MQSLSKPPLLSNSSESLPTRNGRLGKLREALWNVRTRARRIRASSSQLACAIWSELGKGVSRSGPSPISQTMSNERPKYSAGKFGQYTCTRCGWKWTPRAGCPDPPWACARCRTAYWQTTPRSSRANSPDDPKWQAQRELVARRRRERHLAKLTELAAELGLQLPPIGDAITATKGLRQPAAPLRPG